MKNVRQRDRRIPSLRKVAACACAVALACSAFTSTAPMCARDAYAVTAAEKRAEADEVWAQVDSLQTSLNEASYQYEQATAAHDEAIAQRDEAQRQIEEETKRIEKLQAELSDFAVGMYKQGDTESFLNVLLQTSSFEEFLTSWDVLNRVSVQGTTLIETEKAARESLEQAKAEFEEQSAIAADQMAAAEASMIQIEQTQEALREEAAKITAEAAELQAQEDLAAEAARQAEEARLAREAELAAAYEAAQAAAASDDGGASGGDGGGSSSAPGGSVLMGSGYFTNPCPSATESSGFGYRTFDNSFHKGLDMAAPEGTPYYAADSGTVMYATNDGGYNGGAGNWVVISHGNGIVTKYMHSSATFVTAGEQVTRGQNIGLVGNTGASFGAHLHFQVEVDGVAVNPLNYI